jgi:hypothetical protein
MEFVVCLCIPFDEKTRKADHGTESPCVGTHLSPQFKCFYQRWQSQLEHYGTRRNLCITSHLTSQTPNGAQSREKEGRKEGLN